MEICNPSALISRYRFDSRCAQLRGTLVLHKKSKPKQDIQIVVCRVSKPQAIHFTAYKTTCSHVFISYTRVVVKTRVSWKLAAHIGTFHAVTTLNALFSHRLLAIEVKNFH